MQDRDGSDWDAAVKSGSIVGDSFSLIANFFILPSRALKTGRTLLKKQCGERKEGKLSKRR
jgi:hypothetical protein